MIDARDNDNTDKSPCQICKRKNLDKNLCVDKCERIAAYREGKSYKDLPSPEITTSDICLIEGCEDEAKIRGLCTADYNKWIGGYILHPQYGKFIRKDTMKTKEKSRKSKSKLPDVIKLKLAKYSTLANCIYDLAENSFVTPRHMIIQLLSEAVAARINKTN